MNSTKCFTALRSPAGDEIALAPALSPFDKAQGRRWNGRGSCPILRAPGGVSFSHPRPLAGERRVRERSGLKRLFVALAAAVSLSGCMVGPDYQRPPVTAPGVFRGAPPTAPDPQSIGDLKWFEVFKDEQLQELIRTALIQNYDLRDAVARVDAARANLGITRADQYPNFGVGADVTAVEQSRRGQFTIPRGTSRQRTFGTVFLNLFTFEIDIWGRLRRATEAARAELLAA